VSDKTTNCWKELNTYVSLATENWRRDLNEEKMLRMNEARNASEQLSAAYENLEILRNRYVTLEAEFQKSEKELRAELEKMHEDREELLKKLGKSEDMLKKIMESDLEKNQRTTAKPTLGILNSAPFKKMTDIVKRIETVGRLFGNVFKDGI
jgi:hypothetical protein